MMKQETLLSNPMKLKLKGYVKLFRPELPFAAGVCVILGELVALGGFPPLGPALLGFACAFFLSGTALVMNDYFDLEVDRVNAPERTLPSRLVSPREAFVFAMTTAFLGLAAALVISLPALILSLVFWAVGFLYNWKFKQSGLLGNLMVSSSVAITFILGGIAVGQPWNPIVWIFSLQAFLIDLSEEIAGDAMDMDGDKKRASKSIALVRGKTYALRLSGFIFVLVVLSSFIPYLLGWFGTGYLILVSVMDLAVLYFTTRLIMSQTPMEGRTYMRRIYLLITFGMLVFILSQFFT